MQALFLASLEGHAHLVEWLGGAEPDSVEPGGQSELVELTAQLRQWLHGCQSRDCQTPSVRYVPMSDTDSVTIDCDTCTMQHSTACADCVVTYICDREPTTAVVINLDDFRSMRRLAKAGLVPDLRHQSH